MKTIIYYFSGTGNSLYLAKGLSKRLGSADVRAISDTAAVDASADVIGLVFPVYLWGMPQLMEEFVARLPRGIKNAYIFALASYKCDLGDCAGAVSRAVAKTGNRLSSFFSIPMPGNNIIYYDIEPADVREKKLAESEALLDEAAAAILAKAENISRSGVAQRLIKSTLMHRLFINSFAESDKNLRVTDDCIHCGACAKVCPVGNIDFSTKTPVWQHHCQQCVACISACPKAAIQYKNSTVGRQRYINPSINVSGLIECRNGAGNSDI